MLSVLGGIMQYMRDLTGIIKNWRLLQKSFRRVTQSCSGHIQRIYKRQHHCWPLVGVLGISFELDPTLTLTRKKKKKKTTKELGEHLQITVFPSLYPSLQIDSSCTIYWYIERK